MLSNDTTDLPRNPSEEWRPAVGYEGVYHISNQGRIYSVRRQRLLKPQQDLGGYIFIGLTVGGVCKQRLIHRLVAEAFTGPIPDGLQVNHKDGVKANNTVSNLAYVTPRENIAHAVALGLGRYGTVVCPMCKGKGHIPTT